MLRPDPFFSYDSTRCPDRPECCPDVTENSVRMLPKYAIGYMPIERKEANLFFNLISELYEKASVIITSNKIFDEWAEMMGDEVMTVAMLDRLLHHSKVFNLSGESFRIQKEEED